jgi:prevent-host-death family protein
VRQDRYSVVYSKDRWLVRRNGKESLFSGSRAEAIRFARKLAEESGGELIVHAKDGGIASRASFAALVQAFGRHIGAYDAKTRFSELLERVEQGEEVTITRHGTPVARLVPVRQASSPEQRRSVVARMINRRASQKLGGLKVKDLIAEGRR